MPDFGVCTRRFEGRYIWSGQQGPRDHVLRLERDVLGGFEELWNMWVRARRTMGRLLRGVLEEVTGS